ncbi:IS66 family insertion sequence element accessory protein TnpA [Virgibacillus proomii]|uniref:IS66 family insertion sequence element accessory protein TnpA n=1 Tax=Virgibacillus proomii TaxID=84407 RepID=UPI0040391F9B
MTLKDKRIEWRMRYDAWKKSGQSIAEWCRGQELKRIRCIIGCNNFVSTTILPEVHQ